MNRAIDSQAAWDWCLQHYAAHSARLLRRQDEEGLDVVLELFASYLRDALGTALRESERAALAAHVAGWRAAAVLPLRTLRRALKKEPAPGAGGAEACESVRALVQQAELQAERVEFDALCEWWSLR